MTPQTFPFVIALDNGDTVLKVTFRPPTIDDQFAFRASLGDGLGQAITKILSTCTVAVEDPGPWLAKADADGKEPPCGVDWSRVTSGIRLQALLTLKMHSKKDGHLIDVDLVCPSCKTGEDAFSVVVDSRPIPDGELLWFEPEDPETVVNSIVTGTPLEAEVGGIAVKVKPPSGTSELKLQESAKALRKNRANDDAGIQGDVALKGRALQLATVDGVHVNDIGKWVRQLPEDYYDELEAAIEATDWGVELSFSTHCPQGHAVAGEVPFVYLFGRPNTAMTSLRARQRERAMAKKKRPPVSPE